MLTYASHRGDFVNCREIGVAAYLLKPIRQSELREAIGRVLGAPKQKASQPKPQTSSDAKEPRKALRILLAEDNLVNQRLAARILEKRGHHVVVADNGIAALAALDRETFDLVFMDLQMPGMDGFEATALIRQKEQAEGRHLPIVALTAHAMKGDREKCIAAGMDEYLSKPLQLPELDRVLDSYLIRPPQETNATEEAMIRR